MTPSAPATLAQYAVMIVFMSITVTLCAAAAACVAWFIVVPLNDKSHLNASSAGELSIVVVTRIRSVDCAALMADITPS